MHTFVSFVREETERKPRTTAERLLEIFKKLDKNRISLQVQKSNSNVTGINLLTAHGSKGLEFKRVFILDGSKDAWEGSKRGNNYRFSFPDTVTLSGETDVEEAKRRLFYVAITRAKERLQISYAAKDKKGKERSRAIFVDEILQKENLKVTQKEADATYFEEAQILLLLEMEQEKLQLPPKPVLDHLLEGFQLSVSAMNQYLRCPVSFYYENVLRVPVVQSEAASYGTAMHNALQRLFERMTAHEKFEFPSLVVFVEIFDFEMANLRGYFRSKTYQQNLQRGREHLAAYYNFYRSSWAKKVLVEKNISTEVGGVPIKGVIDRLNYLDAETAAITDYKTGSQSTKKIQKPTEREPLGGTYWRQLYFYKILFENHKNTNVKVLSGEISYLERDSKGKHISKKVVYEPDGVKLVEEMMKTTYDNILNHKFEEGCGEDNCSWCQFLNEQKAVASFADAGVEELDD